MKKKAFLFDGNSFCYRAFYAIAHLSNSKGEPTNAVYGFLTMMLKIIKTEKPDYIVICFDREGPTFRHEKYKDYKSHRKPMPDDLASQIPRIKEVIKAYNIRICEKQGVEADDLLGTLAKKFEKQGINTYIVTADKDALQLVDERIKVYNTYRDTVTIYDRKKVKERFNGLGPEQVTDIMALMGDQSDNIPGVPGIGEKTALSYIKEFGSLKKLYKEIEKVKSESKQKLLREHKDLAFLSQELATIDCDIAIDAPVDDLVAQEPDQEKLRTLFQELEFRKFLNDIEPSRAQEKEKNRTYQLIDDEKTFRSFLKKIQKIKAFAFDTETTSEDPLKAELVGMSFSWKEKEAWYIALTHAGIKTKKGVPLKDVCDRLKPVLEDSGIQKYGQNIKYDALVLGRYDITLAGIEFDTMIAAYLVNPTKLNQNLDDIALMYLNLRKVTFSEVVGRGRERKRIDEVSVDLVSEYACEDADTVYRLVPILTQELKKKKLTSLFEAIEMPLISVLITMERNGVYINQKMLKKLSGHVEKELDGLRKTIYTKAGEEFNINSPKQLSVILFEKLKLPVIKKTKTGYSTDVSVLETLAEKHVIAERLLLYREYAKLKSTYLDALPEMIHPETGMVHTSFNQTVTSTGRLSSSSPNLQNIPIKTDLGREVRTAFVPRGKDRVILSADYSQIELRFLAHFSKDKKLQQAFSKKRDIHTFTATLLYDVAEDAVTTDMRHVAKTVNFSIIYGKTPFGLARDLGISIADAKDFIDNYFARYPGIRKYLDSLKDEARTKGYVETILGRRVHTPEIHSRNATLRQFAERAAMNGPLQGSAADLVKKAMIDIHTLFAQKTYDVYMVLQVHDELVFDVAQSDSEVVAGCVQEAMENALPLDVPLCVDVHIGKSWYKG